TAADLSFSPDGSSLVFATSNVVSGGVYQVSALVQTDANGEVQLNPPELIIPNTDGVDYSQPSFAPNINALLVRVMDETGGYYQLFDLASGELIDVGVYDDAHWLADGRLLAFNSTGVFILDSVTLAAIPVYTAQQETILSVSLLDSGRLGVLVKPDVVVGPSAVVLVDVPITGGAPQITAEPGYIFNPTIARNTIFGLTRAGGSIMIFDLQTQTQTVLRAPLAAMDWTFID
ncbi:MAG: hypothetical protein CUN56_02160, partial [Phototrophicales bacterium]